MNLKNIKKLSIVFCLVLLFSSASVFNITNKINAEERYKPQELGYVKGTEVIIEDNNDIDTIARNNQAILGFGIMKLAVNGDKVFCIEPMIIDFVDGNYTPTNSEKYGHISNAKKSKISEIIYWGYSKNATDMNFAIVQIMIWEELGYDVRFSGTVNDVSIYNEDFKPVYQARKQEIQQAIAKHSDRASFDGYSKNVQVGETITLTDTNGVLKDFQTITSDNSAISIVSRTDTTLTLKVNSYTASEVKIEGQKIENKYVNCSDYIYYNPKPESQDVMKGSLPDPIYLNVTLNIEAPKGSIEIIKYEDDGIENSYTGKLVEGTEFVLSSNSDMSSPIGTYTTDINGVIQIKDITVGTYYLQETSTQAHLEVDSTIHTINVKQGETTTIEVENEFKLNNLIIFKKDEDGNLVSNTSFKVWKQITTEEFNTNNQSVLNDTSMYEYLGIYTTGPTGSVTIEDLKLGNYIVKEHEPPHYLELDEQAYLVEVKAEDTTMDYNNAAIFTSVNTFKTSSINVNKVDSVTKQIIKSSRFVFALYSDKDCTQLVGEVNGKDGIATFTNIRYGTYYLREEQAPVGYEIDQRPIQIDINDNTIEDKVYTYEMVNILLPVIETNVEQENNSNIPIMSLITLSLFLSYGIYEKFRKV